MLSTKKYDHYQMKQQLHIQLQIQFYQQQLIQASPHLLSYLQQLIYPSGIHQFHQKSHTILTAISRVLDTQETKQKLMGATELLMGILICGHIHIYQSFNKMIFKKILEIYETHLSIQKLSKEYHLRSQVSERKSYRFESIQEKKKLNYRIDLCKQIIYLTAEWFPFDFIYPNQTSIYTKAERKYHIKSQKMRNRIFDAQYLKKLQRKMLDFELDKEGRCELCDLTIKESRSDAKLQGQREKIIKKVNNKMEQRRRNKKKNTQKIGQKERETDLEKDPHAIKTENSFKQLFINFSSEKNQQKIDSNTSDQLSQIFDDRQSIPQIENLGKKISHRVSMRDQSQQDSLVNLETESIYEKSAHFGPLKSANSENQDHFQVPNSLLDKARNKRYQKLQVKKEESIKLKLSNTKASPSTTYASRCELNCLSISKNQSDRDYSYRFELGSRIPENTKIKFTSIQLSGLQYKVYKGIIKLMYEQNQTIQIHEPKNLVLKHKQRQRYYMLDLNEGGKIVIEKNDEFGSQAGKQNKINLPIGYIKMMRQIQVAEWELNKSSLLTKKFMLDKSICSSIKSLAKRLYLNQKIGDITNNFRKKYETITEINKSVLKLTLFENNRIIQMECWCSENEKCRKIANQVTEQIIYCYGIK